MKEEFIRCFLIEPLMEYACYALSECNQLPFGIFIRITSIWISKLFLLSSVRWSNVEYEFDAN